MTFCPACGRRIPGASAFCSSCGVALLPTVVDEAADAQRWPGERKHLTVFFADLCGSTEQVAEADPEDARRLLDAVVARMVGSVRSLGGIVVEVLGDGVLAAFGAPIAMEDHAIRACRAASSLHAQLAALSEGQSILVRVGLHSGTVVIGPSPQTGSSGYRLYGSTVHLAARAQQLASPGSTLVTSATAALLGGRWLLGPCQEHHVKGFAAPITVRAILGGQPDSQSHPADVPIAGRAKELQRLHGLLANARAGAGRVILICGEAGLGKSRLVRELLARNADWRVLIARCDSVTHDVPYAPLVELLRSWLDIRGVLSLASVEDALGRRHDELRKAAPALAWLMSPGDVSGEFSRLDPAHRRKGADVELRRLLRAETMACPVLLVVEDLHWADEETARFLSSLAADLQGAAIQLLLTTRPDPTPRWQPPETLATISIEPLDPAGAEALLKKLLGDGPALRHLCGTIGAHCAGNPFFIEETVRALVENGTLQGGIGQYELVSRTPDIPVAPSVEALLAARIDGLGGVAKHVLRCAAVIGARPTLGSIRAVSALAEEQLRVSLHELVTAGLLIEHEVLPELRYDFRHDLIRQVAYAGLLNEQRRELHARVVLTLLAQGEQARSEQVEAIGMHAFNGGMWSLAVQALRDAGLRATARSAHRPAISFIEQALEANTRLPQTAARDTTTIDLLCDARVAMWAVDEHRERILNNLKRAAELAARTGDRRRRGRVASFLVQEYRVAGRLQEAIETGEQALAIGRETCDIELVHETRFRLALTYLNRGDLVQTSRLLLQNVDEVRSRGEEVRVKAPGIGSVLARTWLAVAQAELGEIDAAVRTGTEAVKIATAQDPGYSLVSAELGLGCALRFAGELSAARQTLVRGLDRCESAEILVLRGPLLFELGSVLLADGRSTEALQPLAEAADLKHENGRARAALYLAALASAQAALGRLEAAQQTSTMALSLARTRGEHGHEAWALRASGTVSYRMGRVTDAICNFRAARSIAETLSMRPLLDLLAAAEQSLSGSGPAGLGLAGSAAL